MIGRAKHIIKNTGKNFPRALDALVKSEHELPYWRSYSQEGEDMLLKSLLGHKTNGFYVDVGAHHPSRFSNTAHFYEIGWRGINIDASSDAISEFEKKRASDINLNYGVGPRGKLTYFIYDEPAVNTLDEEVVKTRRKEGYAFKVIRKKKIEVHPLKELLDKHLPPSITTLDFLNVDVEGMDLEVLKTNDWNLYRPKFLLVESYGTSFNDVLSSNIYKFLEKKGYSTTAKTLNTVIFYDRVS